MLTGEIPTKMTAAAECSSSKKNRLSVGRRSSRTTERCLDSAGSYLFSNLFLELPVCNSLFCVEEEAVAASIRGIMLEEGE
ncbi:hypothetical protein HanIR_Chr09g0397381 [Helianthus annuus]|nr:hypothetical protein HanIR_Chr09g0397381 [Helianthus annuus]